MVANPSSQMKSRRKDRMHGTHCVFVIDYDRSFCDSKIVSAHYLSIESIGLFSLDIKHKTVSFCCRT